METLRNAADTAEGPKRARILDGALKVFLAYGYARTTMDDIARAADVSRPALYLVFRNKTDIYRAIGAALLTDSVEKAKGALAREEAFDERLMAALDLALFQSMAMIHDSPHGAEILDMKNSLAADLIEEWRVALSGEIARAIAEEATRRGVDLEARGLTPAGLADTLLDGLEGMKARGLCNEAGEEATRRLVTLIDIALRA